MLKRQFILSIIVFIVLYISCLIAGVVEKILLAIPVPMLIIIFCVILYKVLRKEIC